MNKAHCLLTFLLLQNLLCCGARGEAPANDNFANRIPLGSYDVYASSDNTDASREAVEPRVENNEGGKSVWWTWTAPQNGTVTISTERSGFDTILGVFIGSSLESLQLVASGDDSTGPDPLSSIVQFHSASGMVYQIMVDGYRGDDGQVATGVITLGVNFLYDRYALNLSVNETNRGFIGVSPEPGPDGKYLVGTKVSVSATPFVGWQFGGWSNAIQGAENPVVLEMNSNTFVHGVFTPIYSKRIHRSPSGFTRFFSAGNIFDRLYFKVWNPDIGTLDYKITTDVDWLTVTQPGGSVRSETNTHEIQLRSPDRGVGSYVGTVVIRPLAEGAEAQSLVIGLRVDPASPPLSWYQPPNGPSYQPVVIEEIKSGGFILGSGSFIRRIDARGSNIWEKSYPGMLRAVLQMDDGGYLFAGMSGSEPYEEKSSPHYGGDDIWLVRTDEHGTRLWDRSFGGTNDEYLLSIRPTPDHGFLMGAQSLSGPSGNKTSQNFGGTDLWAVKLDGNGKRLWDRSFGGTNYEYITLCDTEATGTIIVAGTSASGRSGNKTNEQQGLWGVRLDSNGRFISELSFEFTVFPEFMGVAPDGGFLLSKNSTLVKTYSDGTRAWQTNFLNYPFHLMRLEVLADGNIETFSSAQFCCSANQEIEAAMLSKDGSIAWKRTIYRGNFNLFDLITPTSDGAYAFFGSGFMCAKTKPFPSVTDGRSVYSGLGFRLILPGEPEQTYVTQFSSDLLNWLPLRTNKFTSTELEIFDESATNFPTRFYRTLKR